MRRWTALTAALLHAACSSGQNASAPDAGTVPVHPERPAVGGFVRGLVGHGLILRNGNEDLAILRAGGFAFPTPPAPGTAYSVSIAAQPMNPPQTCEISNGSGTFVEASPPAIAVFCRCDSAQIVAGPYHTVVLRPDGTLWAWGENASGQLGDGTRTRRSEPVQVGTDSDWTSVSAGPTHSVALKRDGTLWAWGSDNLGQLGLGASPQTVWQQNAPVRVGTGKDWASVAAGASWTAAIKTDGTLWTWGANWSGQLGDDSPASGRNTPVQVGTGTRWASVAAGDAHALAIKADGTLWAWGYNAWGQIGDGTGYPAVPQRNTPVQVGTDARWISVYAGYGNSMALRADGTLWAWGGNWYGELGDGTTFQRNAPVEIGTETRWASVYLKSWNTVAVKTDGTLWAWGDNGFGQLGIGQWQGKALSPTQVGTDTDWTWAAAGLQHAVAAKADGALWSWGDNGFGQLGNGAAIQWLTPVQIGTDANWKSVAADTYHTAAVKTDGSIWVWGWNDWGQIGDGTTAPRFAPVQAGPDTSWLSVAPGFRYTMALKTDGTLWAWGSGPRAEFFSDNGAVRTLTASQVGTDAHWAFVAAGAAHAVAIKRDGTLWSWGDNASGQLGDGTTTARTAPVQVGTDANWASAATGRNFTVAIRTDGTLWAWGDNGHGQLGDGTAVERNEPVRIGTAADWASIAASYDFSLAIKQDGTLWAWGDNSQGQLGDGTTTWRNVPVQIGTDSHWASVAAGAADAAALKTDGTLWTWGMGLDGQLGDGTTGQRNAPRQVGTDTKWASVAEGYWHTMALKTDGTLWGWGLNPYGQIGTGTNPPQNTPQPIPWPATR